MRRSGCIAELGRVGRSEALDDAVASAVFARSIGGTKNRIIRAGRQEKKARQKNAQDRGENVSERRTHEDVAGSTPLFRLVINRQHH